MQIPPRRLPGVPQLWGMKEELSAHRRRDWARMLYTKEGLPIKDVALMTGSDEAELRHWATQGEWEGQKRTLLTSKEKQLTQLYDLLEKVMAKMTAADDINPKDADLAAKYTAAIRNLDAEITVPQIIEVAKLFTLWLRRRDAELAKAVTLQLDHFIRQRLKPVTAE